MTKAQSIELLFPQGEELSLYCDGGSRGNPGMSGAGFVIRNTSNGKVYLRQGIFLGVRTNNQAEYIAVYKGVEKILQLRPSKIHIFVDSQLVARQLEGTYKIKDQQLKEIATQVFSLLAQVPYDITHIYREENADADEMANVAMDKGEKIGECFIRVEKV